MVKTNTRITTLLLAFGILLIGHGLQLTLLPLYALSIGCSSTQKRGQILAVQGVYCELVSEIPANKEKYREIPRNFLIEISDFGQSVRLCADVSTR